MIALRDFYLSMFPKRSLFELPVGVRNKFSYVQELREWQAQNDKVCFFFKDGVMIIFAQSRQRIVLVFLVLAAIVMLYIFVGKIKQIRRYLLKVR